MGHDEPLVATYRTQRPPWVGLWSSRQYTGRPDWWTEAGGKDETVRAGKLRLLRSRYREEDPDWYDPKVPDGTSVTGPLGLDSQRNKDLTVKADTPGDLADFQQKVYESSHQYKALAEAFDLSKEHPGAPISPALTSLGYTPKDRLGRTGFFPNSWYTFGPRFFDKPLNEGTFTKGLAAVKYTAIAMVPITMVELRALGTVKANDFSPRTFFQRYAKLCPIPFAVSFSWAVALSTAANIRNKDDIHNHFYASAAVGIVIASAKDNITMGTAAALVTLVLGTFWQYARITETGLQSRAAHPTSGGIWGGPFVWKGFLRGESTPPTTVF